MRARTVGRVLPAAILGLLLFAADGAGDFVMGTPLATLGKQVIREADLQRYLEVNGSFSDRGHTLEEYLDSIAIAAKARRAGIDQETRFKKALWLGEVKALSQLVTERYRSRIVESSQVSAEEVRTYYEEHQQEFTEEPRFTAHHLLVYVKGNPAFPEKGRADAEARTKATKALAELRAGRGWDAVVKDYSDEITASANGGLIRDGKFGYFAPEVERAIRTQELGQPGEVIRSVFGYHLLEVKDRVTDTVPRPFEQVKEMLADRLAQERSAAARKAFITPIREEMGFELSDAGAREGSLLDERAVASDETLATVGGKKILESDFRWFLKDALLPEQRTSAYSRPGARQAMLSSFLDMLVLAAKAKKEGLDRTPDFIRRRIALEQELLSEFMQARDRAGPFCQCQQTDEERRIAHRDYFDRVRAEVGLLIAPPKAGR